MAKNKNNQSVWKNRILKKNPTFFEKIGNSIDVDKRLFKEDIKVSIIHAEMLLSKK